MRVSAGGTSFAKLLIPKKPVTTDVRQRIIHLTFSNVPFTVVRDQHIAFKQFLASTTMSTTETFTLSGKANTDAETAVGLLSLRESSSLSAHRLPDCRV